ncbi:translation initiation factor IF-2, partial [bacterium]|nr:translation initiation factor IF-2 [bacterium]
SKDVIEFLKKNSVEVANHMAVIPDDSLAPLEKQFKKSPAKKPAPSAKKAVSSAGNSTKKSAPPSGKAAEKPATPSTGGVKTTFNSRKKPARGRRGGGNKKGRQRREFVDKEIHIEPVTEFTFDGDLPLSDAASIMGKKSGDLILSLLQRGIPCNKNHVLSKDLIVDLAGGFGIVAHLNEPVATESFDKKKAVACASGDKSRWPVVVVMGHVDHGKTTLLDYIRRAGVAAKEKGGITQHLGAYEVSSTHGKIVFVDTPGHEAFTTMRGRGARVTDIAILVVAADDGVMPQTLEAIDHAKQAELPVIVAVNKIDKVDAAAVLEKIKRQLAQHDLVPEDWGGKTVIVPISAKTGHGVEELLEMVVLQAQMMELKADPCAKAQAFILEAKIDRGHGPVATVIPTQGTLRQGDYFVSPGATGKIRSLIDSDGKKIAEAGPSIPVQIAGFDRTAKPGGWLNVVPQSEYSKARSSSGGVSSFAADMREVTRSDQPEEDLSVLNLVVCADTQGSCDAVKKAISILSKKDAEYKGRMKILRNSVGDVSEQDVLFALNSSSYILALNVKVERNAAALTQEKHVKIVRNDVIYRLTDALEELLQLTRKKKIIQKKVGTAEVRKIFPIKSGVVIAGCMVVDGTVKRTGKIKCMRDGEEIFCGSITSLQRDKKVVKEAHAGFECAFIIDGFNEWQVGDLAECILETSE